MWSDTSAWVIDRTLWYRVQALPAVGVRPDANERAAVTNEAKAVAVEEELVLVGSPTNGPGRLLAGAPSTDAVAAEDPVGAAVTSVPGLDRDGRFVYAKGSGAGAELWEYYGGAVDGPQCITCRPGHGAVRGTDPAVAPGGSVTALVSPTGVLALYRDVIGEGLLPLAGITTAASPTWLWDNSGVVIADTRAGRPLRHVTVRNAYMADGHSGTAVAIPATEGGRRPSADPRGARVAYLADVSGQQELRLVGLDGRGRTTLLTGDIRHAGWSPDGSRLVVTRGTGAGSEVVSLDPATKAVTTLLATPGRLDAALLRVVDKAKPDITITQPGLTTGRPTVRYTVTDDTRPAGAVTISCSLDGAAEEWCPATAWTGQVASGKHTLVVRVRDDNGESSATATWTADASLPSAQVTVPAAGSLPGSSATITWSGADKGSGVAGYDFRYRSAGWRDKALSPYVYPAGWQGTTRTGRSLPLTAGTEYCVSARSRDKAGNKSAWSPDKCFARPLDDRALKASAGWTRATSTPSYAGTLSRTNTPGATLRLADARVRRVVVVVTTCPTCGSFEVTLDGVRIGSVNTRTQTTRHRVVRTIAVLPGTQAGDLVIRTGSSRRSVRIDAVMVRQT